MVIIGSRDSPCQSGLVLLESQRDYACTHSKNHPIVQIAGVAVAVICGVGNVQYKRWMFLETITAISPSF
jgi:hypothetical protein